HVRRRPEPVPPIDQTELAAEAIVWAATHRRREVWVGLPTVRTIIAQLIAPRIADRLAARLAYDSQMTDEPLPASRPDNLYAPLPGDRGAHGRFDAQARTHSVQWTLNTHRAMVTGAAIGAAILLGLMRARSKIPSIRK